MADLLDLSSRIIDGGLTDQPVNRVTNELSEVATDIAMVESFSHCVALRTDDGLVCFDSSGVATGQAVRESLRGWSDQRVSHLVYTHGHADHVGGSMFFADDGPTVVGHENVAVRLDRYDFTNNWNLIINHRQFGGVSGDLNLSVGDGEGLAVRANPNARRFLPAATLRPDETFATSHAVQVGGVDIEMHHARGETDDHLWAWLPERKAVMTGDFLIWHFPNAGNPQKVQRYPIEWAAALRAMIAKGPELLLPAHGLPIAGKERIAHVLDDVATVLEDLVRDVVARDERRRDTRRHRAHGEGPLRIAGQAVPAPVLRRARVRRPWHLAPVRRLVGRRSIALEAVPRCTPRGSGRRVGRRRRRVGPTSPAGSIGGRLPPRLPLRRHGRVGRPRRAGGARRRGPRSTSPVARPSRA